MTCEPLTLRCVSENPKDLSKLEKAVEHFKNQYQISGYGLVELTFDHVLGKPQVDIKPKSGRILGVQEKDESKGKGRLIWSTDNYVLLKINGVRYYIEYNARI